MIQLKRSDSEHADTLFWTLQAASLACVGLLIASRGLVESIYQRDDLASLLIASSFVLYFIATALVPRALLARRFGFAEIGFAELTSELAGGVVGVSVALNDGGAWSLVCQQLTAKSSIAVILLMRSGWRPRLRWSTAKLRDLRRFSLSQSGAGILRFLDEQIPRLLLGRYLGAAALGNYFFARQLIRMTERLLLRPIRVMAMPSIARMQDRGDEARRAYENGLRASSAFLYPLFLGALATAPLFVPLLFGEKWFAAVPLVQIFMLQGLVRIPLAWDSALLRGLGRPDWLLLRVLFRFSLALVLMAMLWRWDAVGVAVAVTISSAASWLIGGLLVHRLCGLGPLDQIRFSGGVFAAAALMAAVVAGLGGVVGGPASWGALVGSVFLGGAIYTVALRLLAPRSFAEAVRYFTLLLRAVR